MYFVFACLALGWVCNTAAAWQVPVATSQSETSESAREPGTKKAVAQARAIERKAELLKFVEQHEPQVKVLLSTLESKRPDQFRSALASLSREIDRLAAIQNRDPERFELELREWKNSKRLQIVAAKISLRGETPESRDELRKLLANRAELQKESLRLELARSKDRTEKLTQQLNKVESQTASDLDKQTDQLIANSRRANKGKGSAVKPKER